MAIKAVFWDSDNTLIDTFALHWRKHVAILKSLGISLPDSYKPRIHQNNGEQNWQWLSAELGLKVPCDTYLKLIDEYYAQNVSQLKLCDGVAEALEFFKHRNIPQCVVSNGRRSSVMNSQNAVGITPYFQFILCKEDYTGRKPDPSPFLTAHAKMESILNLKLNLNECLAIDDDPLGVESAKRAEMITIFRPTELVTRQSEYADYTVSNSQDFLSLVRDIK